MTRIVRATEAICEAIDSATGGKIPLEAIGHDEDLVEELSLDALELVGLALILEEIFSIDVPDDLFESPLHRTPAALAEWCVARSRHAAWEEAQAQRRRA